ncbi:hypothetical protein KKF84_15965, partial [Myxococcota bacterium]|nr:hypothetical protein [Myxococcota bacterium]
VYDISSSVKSGDNTVVFIAKKSGVKVPRGSMKIAIAKGYESKGTYIIKNLLWEIKRNSSDKKSSYYSKYTLKK